jgi:hypothetical protein
MRSLLCSYFLSRGIHFVDSLAPISFAQLVAAS